MGVEGRSQRWGPVEQETAGDAARVLVVDDDPALQLMARESLGLQGFTVEEATDGGVALEAFSRLRPDVVLLDVNLPNLDGFAVCSHLRQMAAGANIPVMMMTAADDVEAIHTAYDVGATDFITKPVNWILLGYRLRYVLRTSRVREHLAVSEARLARAQQIARLGHWELDLATGVTSASVEACRILGLETDCAPLGALWERVHPADREALGRALDATAPAVPSRLDVRVVLPGGEERVAHFQAEVVKDGQARPCRVVATIQDVTERTSLEAQLRQAQKMEAVGTLAGSIAHDFSNLLSVINSRSELLQDDLPDSPRARRDLDIIRQAGERAAAMTGQLLAFSRKQVLERKRLDLNAVVTGLEMLVRQLVGEQIVPFVQLAPQLAPVSADRSQMEQVILNLIVNARDAMPEGGQLAISTTNVDLDAIFLRGHPGAQTGPHVALAIRDTGVGMEAGVRARIFEPFFTTKGPAKGTGLGLATVYGIVKQHGGYITAESELGRGSTFTIYLPATAGVAESDQPAPALPARPGAETVLLAEDNPLMRELVVEMLERNGYTVLEARHGRHALDLARAHQGPIDLVLSDVMMPEMGGPELVTELMAMRRQVKVLLVSGYPGDELQKRGAAMDGLAFLAKPFTPQKLLRKVREVLDASVKA